MDEFRIILQQSWSNHLSLHELAAITQVHPDLILRFQEFGLIDPIGAEGGEPLYDLAVIQKVRTIRRLRAEMGVNLAGVAVILELLDKIKQLQAEIEWLR